MIAQTFECQQDFENLLSTVWNKYFVFVWSANKPFTSLKGKQILAFIKLIPEVIAFIESKFMETEFLSNLSSGLYLWENISCFIHKSLIWNKMDTEEVFREKKMQYEDDIVEFKNNVMLFYKYGAQSFLTKKSVGDCETFYMHTLRFYIPDIVDDTWERFQVGIGIFTMQGFERSNKESKNIFRNHTNKRGNQVLQCMQSLWDLFNY